jgi:hypothetical protein
MVAASPVSGCANRFAGILPSLSISSRYEVSTLLSQSLKAEDFVARHGWRWMDRETHSGIRPSHTPDLYETENQTIPPSTSSRLKTSQSKYQQPAVQLVHDLAGRS